MKKNYKKGERRQFLRLGTYHLLKYLRYETQGLSRPILSVARNIGGGGLMFSTNEKLDIGDKLELELNLPPFGEYIKAIAQVVHVEKKKSSEKWQIGVRFLELGDPASNRILDYVDYINKTVKNPDDRR